MSAAVLARSFLRSQYTPSQTLCPETSESKASWNGCVPGPAGTDERARTGSLGLQSRPIVRTADFRRLCHWPGVKVTYKNGRENRWHSDSFSPNGSRELCRHGNHVGVAPEQRTGEMAPSLLTMLPGCVRQPGFVKSDDSFRQTAGSKRGFSGAEAETCAGAGLLLSGQR